MKKYISTARQRGGRKMKKILYDIIIDMILPKLEFGFLESHQNHSVLIVK